MAGSRLFSGFFLACFLFAGSFLPAFGQVTISVGDYLDLDPDEPVWVYVTVDGSTQLSGLSFSLNWDPTVACYTGLDLDFDLSLGTNNFNLNLTLDGQLGFSYFNLFGPVEPGDTLFAVQLSACGSPGSSTPITLSNEPVVIDATGPFVPGGIPPQPVQVLPGAGGQVGFYSIAELPSPILLLEAEGGECLQPGDTQWVCVTVDSVTNFSSLQFSLEWDSFELDLIELDFMHDLPGLNPANFNVDTDGEIGFSWFGFSGSGLKPGDTLFCLQFVLEGSLGSEGIIKVGDSPLSPAASGLLTNGMFPELDVVPGIDEELTRLATDGPPTALCKDVTIELPFNGIMAINVDSLDAGSFDDCQLDTLFTIPDSLFMDDVGVQMVALVAIDSSGSSDTCFSNVTVEIPVFPDPTAICKDITVELDSFGMVIVPADSVNDGSLFIGTLTLDLKPDSFTCNELGDNMVLLGVLDAIGADTCEAVVTVVDSIAPTAVCVSTIDTLYLDDAGVTMPGNAESYDAGSWDNCEYTITLDVIEFDCSNLGIQAGTITVADSSGNMDSCQISFAVLDTFAPTAACQDVTIYLNENGQVQIDSSLVDAGSTDNCDFAITISPDPVSCDNIGVSTLTLTATDMAGNSDTCTAILTVEDTLAPTAVCQDVTVYLDETGTGVLSTSELDSNSSDNCGYTIHSGIDSFSCADLGIGYTAMLIITDGVGLSDTCVSQITVADTIAPELVCVNDTVYLGSDGLAVLIPESFFGGATDNCLDSLVFTLSIDTVGCDMTGVQDIHLFGTDQNGNTNSCQASVVVLDTIVPQAVCQDLTVYLDGQGQAQVDAEQANGGSIDNCDLVFSSLPVQVGCADLGVSNLILIVTDNSGNSHSCIASMTVEDTVAPTAICQDVVVYLDENGMGIVEAAQLDGNSSDNCGYTVQTDVDSFDCSGIGVMHIATLIVTDVSGSTDTCTSQVTVVDTLQPQMVCKTDTVYLGSDGLSVILPPSLDGGSSDNCTDSLVFSLTIDTFDCSMVGVREVVLFGTDQSGNTDSCIAEVLVIDSLPPSALCENAQIFLDADGMAVLPIEEINDGSTDNCSLFFTLSQSVYTCEDVGNQPVTLYVTDASNNIDSCTGTVIVEDTIQPALVCQDLVISLDSSGIATVDATAFIDSVVDNCPLQYMPASLSFDCDSDELNVLEIIGIDPAGNSDTCVVNATVLDDLSPQMVCNDITVQLNPSGTWNLTPAQVDGGSTDNCGLDLEVEPNLLTTADIGVISVTLIGTDSSGNVDSCTSAVTVVPFGSGPTAICKDITANLTANGTVTVPAASLNNGSLGNGPLFFLLIPGATFTCSDIGPNDVMLVVQDNNGSDTCDAVITVQDLLPPAINCVDGTVTLDETGQGTANINDFLTVVEDNCGLGSTSMSPLNFNCQDVGTTTAEIIAVDAGGNADTCYVEVTVSDTMVPVAHCDTLTVELDANGTYVPDPAILGAASTDNCANLMYTLERDTLGCADLGVQTLALVVTDPGGNSDVCTVQITIEDTQTPVASCQDFDLYLGADGSAILDPLDIDGGSSDNCPLIYSASRDEFSCADLGGVAVILTVTDGAGNDDQCAANVDVLDTLPPTVVCRDITVQLDSLNEVFVFASQVDNGSGDNCSIFSIELDTSFFDIDDLGQNPVVLTVTDQSGNSSTCTAIVTVVEYNTPAAARCKDVTLSLDASGTAILLPNQINDGSTGAGTLTFEVVPNVFTCDDIGLDSALLFVSDDNNTSDSCTSLVTVIDDMAPNAQCSDIQVSLDEDGQASIISSNINLGSSDNCEITASVLDSFMFDCDDIGENIVTLTVTDQSGNSSQCTAVVTVQDEIQPEITCKDVIINLQIEGLPADTLTISQLATATDNCTGLTISAAQLIFDCSDLGVNTVLMTASDIDGNSVVCQSTVTVRDVPLNNPLCKNTIVQLDASGQGEITAQDVLTTIPQGVCNPITITLSESDFNCSDLGLNTIGVTVNNGVDYNFTCSAQVTVVDQEAPMAECKDITISLNNSGTATITPISVDNGSTDNCAVTNRLLSRTNFNCNDAGTVVAVNLTVTDQSGNTDVCTSNVTVSGSNEIVAECKNVVVSLDQNGSGTITPQMVNDGSSVDCGTMMLSLSQTSFDCDDIGNQQVVLTVSNGFGSSETCTATVSVSDDLPPLLTCADVTLELNLTGSTTLDPTEAVDPFNTFDNCGDVQLLGISPFSFDCSDVGAPVPFALTAADENGNSANCAGTVTINAPTGYVPFLEFIVTPESGPGQMDGGALVQVIGGSGAFEYEWSTGSSNSFIANLSAGEYCVTVTDLNTNCQVEQCVDVPVLSPSNISISGLVETEEGLPVRSVNVRLFGSPNDSTLTPSAGTYSFFNIPSGLDWEVSPYKDINDKNGVTTFDLVLISQHILQVFSLDSPYKLIAADANSDQKISTLDILDLRLLILQIVDKLPNNTSWRFVDADYVFPKPDDPFIDTFPETVMLPNVTQSVADVDFIGVKIGDVDLSADPLFFDGGPVTLNRDGEQKPALAFAAQEQILERGEIVEVPIRASDFNALLGYQMTIDFDPSSLILQEIVPSDELGLTRNHFGYRFLEDGLVSANWFSAIPQDLEDGTELFRLVFRVGDVEGGLLSEALRFSSGLLSSEAYQQGEGKPMSLSLRFDRQKDAQGKSLHLYAPRPNPFRDQTVLGFELPEEQSVEVRCVDASGRFVYSTTVEGVAGYNELTIEGNQLPQAGLYFFQLLSSSGTKTVRIMKLD